MRGYCPDAPSQVSLTQGSFKSLHHTTQKAYVFREARGSAYELSIDLEVTYSKHIMTLSGGLRGTRASP